jgi:hypothetical protein
MTTSSLTTRITDYILKRTATTLTQLEGVVVSHGFTLDDLYTALEQVHRNKSIARTVRQGEVVYMKKAPPKSPTDHLAWVRANYPWPDNFEMPFPEIDMSFLFLKTKEERDAFKAEMSGRPVYTKNTWQKKKANAR